MKPRTAEVMAWRPALPGLPGQPEISRDWMALAACQYTDAEVFFPELGEFAAAADSQADQARGVCIRCPVRVRCFQYAQEAGEQGVWGGLGEGERQSERLRVPRRSPLEAFAEADARYLRRQARRLARWAREAGIDERRSETDRIERLMEMAA